MGVLVKGLKENDGLKGKREKGRERKEGGKYMTF
jgi:hypothetical protein